jgi:hypothetical protein
MSQAAQTEDEFLLRYLRARDGVLCPLCRNDLGGIANAICPRCGEKLIVGIGIANPYLHAWVTMAAALLLGAGLGVLVVLVTLSERWPNETLIRVALCYFIANIPLAAVCLIFRRRFLRLSRGVQWWIAIPVAVTTLAMFLFLFSLMT